jgi:hypothetical protein
MVVRLIDQDDRTYREFANVLGTGCATIRVAPARFVHTEGLDHALDTIAATAGRRPRRPAASKIMVGARQATRADSDVDRPR